MVEKKGVDILEAIQTLRSRERQGGGRFDRAYRAPEPGPDYRLIALQNEDERLRLQHENSFGTEIPLETDIPQEPGI